MASRTRSLVLNAIALLSIAHPTYSGQQSEETLPFETIVKYVSGGGVQEGPTVHVVTDRREWKKIWKLAHRSFPSRPPLPEIDFNSRLVLAVFHGFTNGNCTKSITNIVKTENGLVLYVKETCPGPTCGPQPAFISMPLEIVAIDKVDKNVRKKDPEVILDIQFIECKTTD
jgi:hypothetical protein